MNDLIGRQAAIDALAEQMPTPYTPDGSHPADEGIFAAQEIYADCIETIKLLPSAQPEQNWIPCSKQLPKQGQEVICQCRANIIKVLKLDAYGDWYQDADHCYMGGFAIAWMPLPEPYKEGETT